MKAPVVLKDERSHKNGHGCNVWWPSDIWCLYNHRENVEYHICNMKLSGDIFSSSEKRMNKFKNSYAMSYQLFKGVW
jgi:hypothetical protein